MKGKGPMVFIAQLGQSQPSIPARPKVQIGQESKAVIMTCHKCATLYHLVRPTVTSGNLKVTSTNNLPDLNLNFEILARVLQK